MNLFRSIAAALLLLLSASPAYAQASGEKIDVGGWQVFNNDNNCSAISTFGEATTVWLAFSQKDDRATLMIMNDKTFAGVTNQAPFDAQLAFVQGENLESKWSTLSIMGVVLDSGGKGVMIRAPGNDFLNTFTQSQFFGLLKGTDAVISIKTDDIAPVIKALRGCAAKLK